MTHKDEKLRKVAKMMAESAATKQLVQYSFEEWLAILQNAGEEKLDDLLLVLEEERDMYKEIDKEAARKKKVNYARFLQRVEKLKFEAEKPEHDLSHKPVKNVR